MAPQLVSERIGQFFVGEDRLEYTEYGAGDRWVVLLHGQLMPRRMHAAAGPGARGRGPPRGHPRPARPRPLRPAGGPARLLDDRLRRAGRRAARPPRRRRRRSIGGTSLGANVASRSPRIAPDRVRGLILEMPVLDNALEAGHHGLRPADASCARFLPLTVHGLRGADPADPARRSCRSGPGIVPRHPRPAAGADGGDHARHLLRPDRAAVAGCGARSRRRRWSSATRTTRSTRPPTPRCSPRRCRTRSSSRASSILEWRSRARPARPARRSSFALECWRPAAGATPAGRRRA